MPKLKRVVKKPGFFNAHESAVLEKMPPTKSLLIASMICEKTAAHIRSATVDSLQRKDFMEIGYRYLQNRKGRASTAYEVIAYSAVALLALRDFCRDPQYIMASAMVFYIANILPNISNSRRYREAEDCCAELLTKRFGMLAFGEIENMPYSRSGLESLTTFMSNKGIDTSRNTVKDIELIVSGFKGLLVYFIPPLGMFFLLINTVLIMAEVFADFSPQQDESLSSIFGLG